MLPRSPTIDAWRGISVLLVIFGHAIAYRYREVFQTANLQGLLAAESLDYVALFKLLSLKLALSVQSVGVAIFFTISGYLITTLLVNEHRSQGSISLRAFYARRICRIFPAYFVFLSGAFLLGRIGAIPPLHADIPKAALFLTNTAWGLPHWLLAHTWSLSVEEQFYFIWPPLMGVIAIAWRTRVLLAILAGLAIFSATGIITVAWIDNGNSFSCIAVGAIVATSARARGLIDQVATGSAIAIALLLVKSHLEYLPIFGVVYVLLIPALIAIVFFGTLRDRGPLRFLVNQDWLRRVGVVSFSLYLWQQLFLADPAHYGHAIMSLSFLFIPCALLSYALVEQPMIRVGRALSDRILSKP